MPTPSPKPQPTPTLAPQTLAERVIDWRPGVEGDIPNVPVTVSLSASDLQSKQGAARVLQETIDRMEAPGAIQLPAGTFTVTSRITLKSGVVLRGQGPDQTFLVFDMPDEAWRGALSVIGEQTYQETAIVGGMESGSRVLQVEDATGFKAGQMVLVYSENDPEIMYTQEKWDADWARQSLGQIVRVQDVEGNEITIDVDLRLTYQADLEPRIRVMRPITWVGIEDVHLRRLDQAEDSIVAFQIAENCWMRNVVSQDCNRAHVWISQSRFLTIEGSYFHHAWDYGGGGHGYGVTAGKHATDCLVTNNAFAHLRHAMMVKEGANGNVFSYNYSVETTGLCDISIHGHYSYANLFEGNDVQFIQYADYWGPTGPRTTTFRNRVALQIKVNDHSHLANVVGNIVFSLDMSRNSRDVLVEDNLTKAMRYKVEEVPPFDLPASLYLDGPPAFWGDRPWPGIGADVDRGKEWVRLPAETRYQDSQSR